MTRFLACIGALALALLGAATLYGIAMFRELQKPGTGVGPERSDGDRKPPVNPEWVVPIVNPEAGDHSGGNRCALGYHFVDGRPVLCEDIIDSAATWPYIEAMLRETLVLSAADIRALYERSEWPPYEALR